MTSHSRPSLVILVWTVAAALMTLQSGVLTQSQTYTNGGVVKFADQCWPYNSQGDRLTLFPQQNLNQKDIFRTSGSLWCSNTTNLEGTLLNLWTARNFLPYSNFTGYVAQVRWKNGIGGFHRMGLGGQWDLDTYTMNSTQLSLLSSTGLLQELPPNTTVIPTQVGLPTTAWIRACYVGLLWLPYRAGSIQDYNNVHGIAAVSWAVNSSYTETGLLRFKSVAYDFCFSGCSDFSRYSLADHAAQFKFCKRVVPSPSLLQSRPNAGINVSQTFIHVPSYFVGVKILSGTIIMTSYVYTDAELANITFFDIVSLGKLFCKTDHFRSCIDWGKMRMSDIIQVMTYGSSVGGSLGLWSGTIVWPPGRVVTKSQLGADLAYFNMGSRNAYDFCRADLVSTQPCPLGSVSPAISPTVRASSVDCTFDLAGIFYFALVPLSTVCLVYLTFRDPDRPFRLTGTPRVPVPVNLLDFRMDRSLVAVAYGTTVQIIYLLIVGDLSLDITTNNVAGRKWLSFVVKILMTLIVGFAFFIVFAGITTLHQPEGVMMGLVFTTLFLVFYSVRIASCHITNKYVLGFQAVPAFICLAILFVYFSLRLARYLAAACNNERMAHIVAKYQFGKSTSHELPYLRDLLKGKIQDEDKHEKVDINLVRDWRTFFTTIGTLFSNWFRHNFPIPKRSDSFSYSPLYLSSIMLGLTAVYMAVVSIIPRVASLISYLDDVADYFHQLHVHLFRDVFNTLAAAYVTGICVATLATFFHCLHMIRTYKRHMKRLYKGDYSFMGRNRPAPLSQLKSFSRFLGIQTGYFIYAYGVMAVATGFVVILVGGFFIGVTYIPFIRNFFFNVALPSLGVVIIVWVIIRVLMNFALDKQASGKFAAIKRPVFFHILTYFFVFYNVLLGIISILIRMLMTATFNAFMLLRLNRPLMPRGWERWDFAYFAYCGFLHMELAHTHPCMLAFLALTKESLRQAERPSQAAKRWHLAYTLVRNPKLVQLRDSYLEQKNRRSDSLRDFSASSLWTKSRSGSPVSPLRPAKSVNASPELDVEFRRGDNDTSLSELVTKA